jgi:allantoinase
MAAAWSAGAGPLRGIRSTRVVVDGAVGPAAIRFAADGTIAAIERNGDGADLLDVGSLVVSPGLVDCHVHINEPGRTDWEGFTTATRAAAAGGVTTLVDMPLNCIPVTTTGGALETKRAACAGQLAVDVGFWGGVIPGNAGELPGLARAGALGCKAFLIHSGIDEFPNATESDLRQAMPVLRGLGLPLLAHAELDVGGAGGPDGHAHAGGDPRAYGAYLASRPRAWEDAAIRLLISLCRETGCAVHIVHLSSASSLPALRDAKDQGLPITVETCPHYLCFDAEAIPDGATHFKCAPPIREHENREALWRALSDGTIDLVISDHSPCTPALKLPERGDFQQAWGGIASLQLGLRAVWTEARRRGHGLPEIAAWMSERPARLAGLATRKGRIAPGLDADLVVWDPDDQHVVDAAELRFRHQISPYVGRALTGRVHLTVVRGQVAFDGVEPARDARGVTLLGRDRRSVP